MKRIFAIISLSALLLTVFTCFPANSQTNDKKTSRQLKRELYKNPDKMVNKEVKKLEKEGWKTMDLPIGKQLERTWEKEFQLDDDGYPKYIYVTTQATSQNYSAAQMEAENLAKVRIVSTISSSVAALADIALENHEITPDQAASMSAATEKAKVLVSGKLGRVITTLSIYKQDKNAYTIRTTVLYDMKQAINLLRDAICNNVPENDKSKINEVIGMDSLINQYENSNSEE
ncbi:MAG: hypothetical protein MJY69_04245 [Bacteroidales bacterium]|nr:hypothetical protein [Bacteroidales bacterium]